jgi:hypothetical protein
MPSPEASRRNLEKAKLNWRRPRPFRSEQESWLIRHLVWQWLTYRGPQKWSARALGRRLGVSHVYVHKLVREFARDPLKMVREEQSFGLATFEQLSQAQESTREMKARGLLRPPQLWKYVNIHDPLGRWPKRAVAKRAVWKAATTRGFRIPQDVPTWATSVYSMYANRWRAH